MLLVDDTMDAAIDISSPFLSFRFRCHGADAERHTLAAALLAFSWSSSIFFRCREILPVFRRALISAIFEQYNNTSRPLSAAYFADIFGAQRRDAHKLSMPPISGAD